jgi:mannose-1-phosphate guanylyltransferase
MERAAGVKAVPLCAGWSDVGTWRAVRDLRGASDGRGNLVFSEVPVLAPGVSDSAIVATREGVLVLPFDREGELRAAVEALRRGSPEGKTG